MKTLSSKDPISLIIIPLIFGAVLALQRYETFSTSEILILGGFFIFFLALFICNRDSYFSYLSFGLAVFLAGFLYVFFYNQFFLAHNQITAKVYGNVKGRVDSVKEFTNSRTGLVGQSLVLSDIEIFQEVKKVTNRPYKKTNKISIPEHKKVSEYRKIKSYINFQDYQSLDRKIVDQSKSYMEVDWQRVGEKNFYPDPPDKVSLIIAKKSQEIAVNDIIKTTALITPVERPDINQGFDYRIYAKQQKIGGAGYIIDDVKIIKKNSIGNIDQWFEYLRVKIASKVNQILTGDVAAIANAFLIGDKSAISDVQITKIRNSGLAHLLSISGFHLALAGAIFFFVMRYLLARNERIALKYDVKIFAAITAVFASYFYLKIAGSPISAQRAFLMILFGFLVFLANEKINARRIIILVAIILIVINPYWVYSVGFQLSFISVLTIGFVYDEVMPKIKDQFNRGILSKFIRYFLDIIIISIFIQIATAPFLLNAFGQFSSISFLSNLIAIPIASFLTMPIGFTALFAMPLSLEKFPLLAMGFSIQLIQNVIDFTTSFSYSFFEAQKFSGNLLVFSTFATLLIYLSNGYLRYVAVFCLAATLLFYCFKDQKLPDLVIDGNQQFLAIYDQARGLEFSKKVPRSSRVDYLMKNFNQTEFKHLDHCQRDYCLIEHKGLNFLVLISRSKISEICHQDFDVAINLTKKYQLPQCIGADKIKLDNIDFIKKGMHKIFIKNQEVKIISDYE